MMFGVPIGVWDAQRAPNNPTKFPQSKTVSFSLSWAGITPSETKDKELVKKYGKGLWLEDVGHTGGRAYLTSNKSIVLIAELHGDDVDSITVASSNAVSYEIPHLEEVPIVKLLPNQASFGGVGLGDDRNTVYKILGPPADSGRSAEGGQILTWGVKNSEAAEFGIVIAGGRVTAFILSYGD